jgi:RNA polymerase sigma-70 factor (ECF subfamily)
MRWRAGQGTGERVLRMRGEQGGRGFEATALPFLDVVYDSALRLTGDPAAAQDLTQETFLRAFRSFSTYRQGTNCRAWLLRIAYNLFCTEYRRRGRLPESTPLDDGTDPLDQLPAADPDPEEAVLRLLDHEALHRALARLPDDFRMVVVLVDIHGLSCAEAAEVMGTPRGTVLSRLHRARLRLRAMLVPELGRHPETVRGEIVRGDPAPAADPPGEGHR